QLYVLIIGKEYGSNSGGKSATHHEYDFAQENRLPTLVCIKGDGGFMRDKAEDEFFKRIKEDGHTYSRFKDNTELHEIVRERLIAHIKEHYELAPTKEEDTVAKASIAFASPFDRQRLHERELGDLSPARVTALALGLDPESRKSLKPADREQLLFDRGYIWFSSSKAQARPTAAGLLLTGKDPTSLFPHCRIQLDIYPGRSSDDEALIAESIRGSIPDAIDDAVSIIRKNTRRTPRVVGLKRIELPEYPETALREALVNALAHRDYEDPSQHVVVEVYFDRIVITNPGLPVGHPSLKRLEKGEARARSRNPLLSQGHVFLHLMDERGTGIRRMRAAMLDHGLELPHVAVDEDRFVLTLPGPGDDLSRIKAPASTAEALPKSVVEELNQRQRAILELAIATGAVTNRQVQDQFEVVRDTAHRDLAILCKLDLLQQKGKGRATHYTSKTRES
ncbi:MAG: ATP-dependent DNA helicase, partial [Candidatus Methanoperedens sp.]|nr:ATP-dependent DNA helicase [Candidatus Methanoperedens sp.]